jgi:hypothetical protein
MPEGSPNVESDVLEMRVIAAVPVTVAGAVAGAVAWAVAGAVDMFEM